MKNLLSLLVVSILSIVPASALAEESSDPNGPYYAFYHMQVAIPGAVVAAMDAFWESDCGKQYPADVALLQESFNGASSSTHFIINTFKTSEDQAKAGEIMRGCPTALAFLQALNVAGTVQTSQYMGAAPIDANDWSQDNVFSKYDIIVEPQNQQRYAAAYAKMMAKIGRDVELRSYGLGVIAFGRDSFTHWVWTGASSIPELNTISQRVNSHPAFEEFNQDVGRMRDLVNTSQNIVIKAYARQ
jgi:hypothetical protein